VLPLSEIHRIVANDFAAELGDGEIGRKAQRHRSRFGRFRKQTRKSQRAG
jgi:hypothetical protein